MVVLLYVESIIKNPKHKHMDKFTEAVEAVGIEVANAAVDAVELSDADGAHSMFEDMGMFEHALAVEIIYFDG
jgi:uroporphyrinogen-III decarboxylase